MASRVREGLDVHICATGSNTKSITWTPDTIINDDGLVLDEFKDMRTLVERGYELDSSGDDDISCNSVPGLLPRSHNYDSDTSPDTINILLNDDSDHSYIPSLKEYDSDTVPKSVEQALSLDCINGNTLWKEAIEKEVGQLLDYKTFQILARGEKAPNDHTRVPLILCFNTKHDGRCKARIVAGGHVTDPGNEDVFSSVVSPECVRVVIFVAEHNGLDVWGGNFGNAYLNGVTELADTLRSLGWSRCKAFNDVWMKDCGLYYEYVAVYSDDIIVASKDPKLVYNQIKKTYTMEGVGVPEYHIGAECGRVKGEYKERGETSTQSVKTFLKNTIERVERELDTSLRTYTCPIDPDNHPDMDETRILNGSAEISKYRMLTGCSQWANILGRLDIVYAVSNLSHYNMAPRREGHMLAMKKLFGYLKGQLMGKIIFDTCELDTSHATYVDHGTWKQTYGDHVTEELPLDCPEPKMKPVDITVYYNTSFACDSLTRRSVTEIFVFLNSTPMRRISKKHNTVETSTYCVKIVAERLGTENVLDFRYVLRMLGVPIVGPSKLLGYNMSVIQNCSLPSSQLKKKPNAITHHRIRECVAADIIELGIV